MDKKVIKYNSPRQINVGQIWMANFENLSDDGKDSGDELAFLFRIVHVSLGKFGEDGKAQRAWLGVKVLNDDYLHDLSNEVTQCWWFDQNGIAIDEGGDFRFVLSHRVGVINSIENESNNNIEEPNYKCCSKTKYDSLVFSEIVDGKVELEVCLANSTDEDLFPFLQDMLDFDNEVRLKFNFSVDSILNDHFGNLFGYESDFPQNFDEIDKSVASILRADFQRQVDRIDAVMNNKPLISK